ncbi:MAG: hypothetical protein JXR07_11930 [Reichenbachiella sp.]
MRILNNKLTDEHIKFIKLISSLPSKQRGKKEMMESHKMVWADARASDNSRYTYAKEIMAHPETKNWIANNEPEVSEQISEMMGLFQQNKDIVKTLLDSDKYSSSSLPALLREQRQIISEIHSMTKHDQFDDGKGIWDEELEGYKKVTFAFRITNPLLIDMPEIATQIEFIKAVDSSDHEETIRNFDPENFEFMTFIKSAL